jgi:hypothetical protein
VPLCGTPLEDLKNDLKRVVLSDLKYYAAEGDLLIPEGRFADYAAERLGHTSLPIFEVKSDGKPAQLIGSTGNSDKATSLGAGRGADVLYPKRNPGSVQGRKQALPRLEPRGAVDYPPKPGWEKGTERPG